MSFVARTEENWMGVQKIEVQRFFFECKFKKIRRILKEIKKYFNK